MGYTATIHPDRVDISLLEQMAKRMSKGTIALVGPSHLTVADRSRLEATARIVFTGQVPYTRVPEFMRAFDVCIAPHLVTAFTESLNPIKLWEYLASGKPIVSTPVAGFRDFPQFVRIAATAVEFLAQASDAVTEQRGACSLRQEEAKAHSWKQRVDTILKVFDEAKSVHRPSQ
jgi:glycosyltransferase involved in cell wall biosynthesis